MNSTKTVFAIFAHPDDAELIMGGTLAYLSSCGYDVHILIVSIPDFKEKRIQEAKLAAEILGAKVHFLNYKEKQNWQVEDIPIYKLVTKIDVYMDKYQPNMVFTHWDKDTHYDHVLVCKAVLASLRRRHVDIYLGQQPNMYAPVITSFESNTYVDVSDFMEKRIEAIDIHKSQVIGRNYTDHVLTRAQFYGNRWGCKYAEVFKCIIQKIEVK